MKIGFPRYTVSFKSNLTKNEVISQLFDETICADNRITVIKVDCKDDVNAVLGIAYNYNGLRNSFWPDVYIALTQNQSHAVVNMVFCLKKQVKAMIIFLNMLLMLIYVAAIIEFKLYGSVALLVQSVLIILAILMFENILYTVGLRLSSQPIKRTLEKRLLRETLS